MDRAEALAYLNSTLDVVMSAAGRGLTDDTAGYGPALDAAFGRYINVRSLTTTVDDTDTDDADALCFMALLRACAYDLAAPGISILNVDFSIDAPLTNVKRSQMFRQFETLRAQAWDEASHCGFGRETDDNVGGFAINLDFKEPGCGNGGEF
jgi:hypothetical protein